MKCRASLSWFVCLALSTGFSYIQAQQPHRTLKGHVRSAVAWKQSQAIGPLPSSQQLNLALVLPVRNEADLQALLGRLYDPSSPDYRHYLSVQQFTAQFGPTAQDYQAVVEFARSSGFTVRGPAENRMLVSVLATVKQVEQAFGVKMSRYRHPTEDREFFSPDREPSVPAGLRISHITGLNNFSVPQPLVKKSQGRAAGTPTSQAQASANSFPTGSGPGGLFLGSDMRAAYYGGTELTGQGQIVGLLEFDGYSQSDVDLTFSSSGQFYSVPIRKVLVGDATGAACQYFYPCDDTEQVIDIVEAIGMAPGLSQVRVYIGANDIEILNTIATENLAKQVSISWGWIPDDPETDDPVFQEFAAQGQSVFVASGDNGSYVARDYVYPAESAYVTAVGGTNLTTAGPAGAWSSESAWSQGGGGVSPDNLPIPTWQSGIANASNGASMTLRNVPDVAMEANIDNYYCAQGSCTRMVGGTSLAAPRWAAFVALANEQGQRAGDALVGFLNPTLYALVQNGDGASDLHDIVSGNNDYTATCKGQPYCSAVSGYDLVTGWGSPAGQALIDALAPPPSQKGFYLSNSVNTLTISPGGSASTSISIVAQGGFTGGVTFALSGVPAGITASWSANPATSSTQLTFTAGDTVPRGSYSITVIGNSGSMNATAVLTLGMNAPGFTIYPAPGDLQIAQGGALSTTIKTKYFQNFSAPVGLAIATPLPEGVTAIWAQNPTAAEAMLTFETSPTSPIGTTSVTVLGSAGGLSTTTTLSLQIRPPAVLPSVSPTFLPITQGETVTTTLTAMPDGGVPRGLFTLSASNLPSGVTVSFNPTRVFSGQSSTLTISSDATTPTGLQGFMVQTSPPEGSGQWYGYWGVGLIVSATHEPAASVSISPSYVVLKPGETTAANITVNARNGFSGSAFLYVAPPPGVTASFTQNPASNHSLLTLTASADAAPVNWNSGLYYNTDSNTCLGGITTCTGGYINDFFIFVQPAASFSLESSAKSIIIPPGSGRNATLTVVPQTGFAGNVQLSIVSNLPPGVTGSFTQNPTTGSTVLAISADSSAVAGTYLLSIAGTSGAQTVTINLPLSIESPTTTTLMVTPYTNKLGVQGGYILAAHVVSTSGQPVRGQVNFCDADWPQCTDFHLLGATQLTPAGLAVCRINPAPGAHHYKAVFTETPNAPLPFSGSSSPEVTLVARGSSATTLSAKGSPGNYILNATVVGSGPLAPSGTISFPDFTQGTVTPATAALGNGIQNLRLTSPASMGIAVPEAISSGDFNGDGIVDLAVANWGNVVTIYLGNGDGSFKFANQFGAGGLPSSITVYDFNGDGNLDLAVADSEANSVTILLGNGDGTFNPGSSIATGGSYPGRLIVADFNRDGIPDLAVTNRSSNNLAILLGNGDGTFTRTAVNPDTGRNPYAIASGDFNGDGMIDLAVLNAADQNVSILQGIGDGTFSPGQSYGTGTSPMSIVAADFNQDGKLDLAVANNSSNTITMLEGNGDGTFSPQPDFTASISMPVAVAIGDFNGDGHPDLAVTNDGNSKLEIFPGNGNGTFSTTPYMAGIGAWPLSIAIADFNQDGTPDVAVANMTSSSVSIELTDLSTSASAIANDAFVSGPEDQMVAASFPGDSNYTSSLSASITLSPGASTETPVFSPAPGTYTSVQTVAISDATPGAIIYYTINGATPTTRSTVYHGAITVSSSETIEAIALAGGYAQSNVASAAYTITLPAPVVTVTPSSPSITTAQSLLVTVALGGTPTPTGTVTLTSGTYSSAQTLLSGGGAIITIPAGSLAIGSDILTAAYTPDTASFSTYTSATGTAPVTVNVPPAFTLSASPASVSVAQGASETSTILIRTVGAFSGTVALTATGLPSGLTASFAPGIAAGTQALTLAAANSAAVAGPIPVTITGTSGSLTASTTIELTITAQAAFAASGASGSDAPITIAAGATTGNTSIISVEGTNGFSGTVNLACSISPAAASDPATCTLSPSSVALSGNTAQTSTLTVTTTAATQAGNHGERLFWPTGGTALAVLLFFTVPRRNWRAMLGLLALILCAGLSACGGGGSFSGGGGSGNPGTTPGTYTVTVTGTSGAIRATVGTVTLTVK